MRYSVQVSLVIFSSFIIALCLQVLPLAYDWQWIRPEWLILVLIYWLFTLPKRTGLLIGWLVGLSADIVQGGVLGKQALSMIIVTLVTQTLKKRLKLFPFWQQAFMIFLLTSLHRLVLFLLEWLLGNPPHTWLYWAPTISSVLFWPWVFRLLKLYERTTFE